MNKMLSKMSKTWFSILKIAIKVYANESDLGWLIILFLSYQEFFLSQRWAVFM